jgi:hypothetical protein
MDMCLSIARFFSLEQPFTSVMHRKISSPLSVELLFPSDRSGEFKRLHKLLVIS